MIEVIGVQASGAASLPDDLRTLVQNAPVVVGSPRLLETLPRIDGSPQRRIAWPRPLLAGLDELLDQLLAGPQPAVVLATGDPLDSGVGATLLSRLDTSRVRVHPALGSVALARARMGWSTAEVDVVSLVSRPPHAIRADLTPGRRLLLLSAGAHTPAAVADELVATGWRDARLTVLGDLGASAESRIQLRADEPFPVLPTLNVVAVELPAEGRTIGRAPGRPDDEFEHDGQLTKSEARACALAALRPAPNQLLWDLGAGAGSIAIEWALHDRRCRAIAVERDPQRAAWIERNAAVAGAVNIRVVRASTSEAIGDLPRPDAVFIGGGADAATIDAAWEALRPGGRLVVHTVTLQTEQLVVEAMSRLGGQLRRISIERAEQLGRYLSWTPARPVVEWAVTRPILPL